MSGLQDFFRKLFSPRLGVDGSAASSAPPPGHVPIGIETNAPWSDRAPERPGPPDRTPDDTR